MNYLDYAIIAVLVISALMGMRVGLIGAAFTVGGVFVGWLLAGQYADDIGAMFGDSLSNDTLVTAISYFIVVVGAIIVANILVKFVRPLLTVFTLGMSKMVDKMGGLALGLLFGLAVSSVLVIGLSRLTYVFDTSVITSALPAQVTQTVPIGDKLVAQVEEVRGPLEDYLTESQLVPIYVKIFDAIPANAFGFVPSDFKDALDILEANIP